MGTKAVVAAGLIGAAAGAGVAGFLLSGGPPPAELEAARAEARDLRGRLEAAEAKRPAAPPVKEAVLDERLASQEARIRTLEADLAAARKAAAPAAAPASAPAPAAPDAEKGARVKADQDERARREAAAAMEARKAQEDADQQRVAQEIEALKRKIADTSLTEDDRAAAVALLRGRRALDRAVAPAIAGLVRGSTSAVLRERVLRDLHGSKDPDFKQLFVDLLRSDPEESVRERAARDIDDYLDDPAVRQALEAARDGDASEKVRARATRTLQSAAK
jgi:hypothetical protein